MKSRGLVLVMILVCAALAAQTIESALWSALSGTNKSVDTAADGGRADIKVHAPRDSGLAADHSHKARTTTKYRGTTDARTGRPSAAVQGDGNSRAYRLTGAAMLLVALYLFLQGSAANRSASGSRHTHKQSVWHLVAIALAEVAVQTALHCIHLVAGGVSAIRSLLHAAGDFPRHTLPDRDQQLREDEAEEQRARAQFQATKTRPLFRLRHWWSHAGVPLGYFRLIEAQGSDSLAAVVEAPDGRRFTWPLGTLSTEDGDYVRCVYVRPYKGRSKGRGPTFGGDSPQGGTQSSGNAQGGDSGKRGPQSDGTGKAPLDRFSKRVVDAYITLELNCGSTLEEVRVQYRHMCLKFHPDRHPDDPAYEQKQKELNRALEDLEAFWASEATQRHA